MSKIKPKYTKNKQVIRDLQFEQIKIRFKCRLGYLKYLGLPSEEMKDVADWSAAFKEFVAVERGVEKEPWRTQHKLLLSSFKLGISHKLKLLRGDIDRVIIHGQDEYENPVVYPFDVVNLDYSGGLLYTDEGGTYLRLSAIKKLIEKQAEYKIPYLLFISCNLDNPNTGEIHHTLKNIKTELLRYSGTGKEVIISYLKHKKEEARLKIYVPYIIIQFATYVNYYAESEKVIYYSGNRGIRMMNFRLFLKHDPRTFAPRYPKERLVTIFNRPLLHIINGKIEENSMALPKLRINSNNLE